MTAEKELVERLRRQCFGTNDADQATMTEAADAIEALIAALRPFAECWTYEELDGAPDDMPIETALYEGSQPTVGDLRKARTLLTPNQRGDNG